MRRHKSGGGENEPRGGSFSHGKLKLNPPIETEVYGFLTRVMAWKSEVCDLIPRAVSNEYQRKPELGFIFIMVNSAYL